MHGSHLYQLVVSVLGHPISGTTRFYSLQSAASCDTTQQNATTAAPYSVVRHGAARIQSTRCSRIGCDTLQHGIPLVRGNVTIVIKRCRLPKSCAGLPTDPPHLFFTCTIRTPERCLQYVACTSIRQWLRRPTRQHIRGPMRQPTPPWARQRSWGALYPLPKFVKNNMMCKSDTFHNKSTCCLMTCWMQIQII